MIKTGVGKSINQDSLKAGEEACNEALDKVGRRADFIIVFSSTFHNQRKVIDGVKLVSGNIPLVGCSSAGEITNEGPLSKSVVVLALETPKIKWTISARENVNKNPLKSGKEVAEEILKKAEGKVSLFLMFSDGLAKNKNTILKGIQKVLGNNFPIVGASAGDDALFKKTYQYFNSQVLTDSLIGIGLSGGFTFGIGTGHSWEPIGLPMKVTKSKGKKIIEIDNRPAISVYLDYFGKEAKELLKRPLNIISYRYPLGIGIKGGSTFLIRNTFASDNKGNIICAAEIPKGSTIQLMISSGKETVLAGKKAAKKVISQMKGKKAEVIFVFDSIYRKKFLGKEAIMDIREIEDILGKETTIAGFYGYATQAPFEPKVDLETSPSVLHTGTLVLLAMGE